MAAEEAPTLRAGNTSQASFQVKVDTTPPVVTLTGVSQGATYVFGAAPAPACHTSDNLSGVAAPATLKITRKGSRGVGEFTATCAGAVDVAGNKSAPVRVSYTVEYGFGGFRSLKPVATVRKSKQLTVTFRLTNAAGRPLSAATAAALARSRRVKVVMTGPRISAVAVSCRWQKSSKVFSCRIPIPRRVRNGRKHSYSISAWEKVTTRFAEAPAVGAAVNPVILHFR